MTEISFEALTEWRFLRTREGVRRNSARTITAYALDSRSFVWLASNTGHPPSQGPESWRI